MQKLFVWCQDLEKIVFIAPPKAGGEILLSSQGLLQLYILFVTSLLSLMVLYGGFYFVCVLKVKFIRELSVGG